MRPTLPTVALITTIATLSSSSVSANEQDFFDGYFTGTEKALSKQEFAALRAVRKAERGFASGQPPVVGADGSIRFVYGVHRPSIVCAPLQVCDLALQAGEEVTNIMLGDDVRWRYEAALVGSGDDAIPHLLIKPLDIALKTSLVITTSRRAYHLRLHSRKRDYMPYVSFDYPADRQRALDALEIKREEQRRANTLPGTGQVVPALDFGYAVTGDARITPRRVYNNGRQTYIEMPTAMTVDDAPVLMAVRRTGTLFRSDEREIVNFRIHNNHFIIDGLPPKLVLLSTHDGRQDEVTIRREER